MDYFHYAYQCPYISGTDSKKVQCDGGCRITFPTTKRCRDFVRSHCADNTGWQNCTIAQMQTEHIMMKIEYQRLFGEFIRKSLKKPTVIKKSKPIPRYS